jgi:predicted short-subunit dehydrogenase-like oxidoreductase (DUF2520 family)
MNQRPRPKQRLRVAIVGGGKVGSVLGRVLADEGARITAVVSRTPASAARAGRFIGCSRTSTALSAIPPDTDLVFIATPHDVVAEVSRMLAQVVGLDFRRLAVCHASGMLTAAVLDPLALLGSAVFSFHPLQTFPRDFPLARILPRARGIAYGVDGPPRGIRIARRMAALLRGRILLIPPESRVLYHAACVVASNHLTTLLAELESMSVNVLPRERKFFEIFRPIIEATLANVAATSPAAALSGPVARGGVETVAQHLRAVRESVPELLPYFTRMSLETVRLASARGTLGTDRIAAMTDLIRSYTDEPTHTKEIE